MNPANLPDVSNLSAGGEEAFVLPPVEWFEFTVDIQRLRPFERNPRTITENQFNKLKQSIIDDGYHSRIKATTDLRVLGGHQRLRAMRELGFTTIPILRPDRELTDEQFYRIMLRDNHSNGDWNMDELANLFDLEYLRQDIGLKEMFNIAPESAAPPSSGLVRCPTCACEFPSKGNKA